MKSKHTPGPWVHDTRGYPHPDVKAANGRNVACTWGVNHSSKTKEAVEAQNQVTRANARLIAAAPDMLAALETCEAFLLSAGLMASDTYAEVCAALNKATGDNNA